ncbi:MAG TPA: hypothetical protein VHG92_01655 [Afifellaceae bacterium]|nr:hypothetical protein [Afifellaceae bacterium]
MFRSILSSAAVLALMGGAASAQDLPSATGLTPGAPLGADPYTDQGIVVGEQTAIERRAAQMPVGSFRFDPAQMFGLSGSASGLTPGAPTSPDPITDSKRVVGERR